jgi:hypothetical protein
MQFLSTEIDDFIERFRAELHAESQFDSLMVEEVLLLARRLRLLQKDERATVVFNNREWERAHDQTSRAFFRNYNALTRRTQASRQTSRPAPQLPSFTRPIPVPNQRPPAPQPSPPIKFESRLESNPTPPPPAPDQTRPPIKNRVQRRKQERALRAKLAQRQTALQRPIQPNYIAAPIGVSSNGAATRASPG